MGYAGLSDVSSESKTWLLRVMGRAVITGRGMARGGLSGKGLWWRGQVRQSREAKFSGAERSVVMSVKGWLALRGLVTTGVVGIWLDA